MNTLDRRFKDMIQGYISKCADSDYDDLLSKTITDSHEIGVIRGRILAMKEIFHECNEIQKELTEPEKKA